MKKEKFRWRFILTAIFAAILLLYSPALVYLSHLIEPEVLMIDGAPFRASNGWGVVFDTVNPDGERIIALSRVNPVAPWKKRSKLLIREKAGEYMIPEPLRLNKGEQVETPLGAARAVRLGELPGSWSPGATSEMNFVLLTHRGLLVHSVNKDDLMHALVKG